MIDEEADALAALQGLPARNGAVSNGDAPDLKRTPRKKGDATKPAIDRLPPYSHEMEQGAIGCILLSPNECLGQCIEKLQHGAEEFYDHRHQEIYKAALAMYEAREPIDIITLQQRLKDRNMLEGIGGMQYLNEIYEAVTSAANLSYYLDIIKAKALLRRIIYYGTDMVGRVYDFSGDVLELVDEIERDALMLRGTQTTREGKADIRAIQAELQGDYEAGRSRNTPVGILSGYLDIDRKCGGMMGQELIIIAGEPSSGKTTLALNIAYNVCRDGHKVSVISMETSAKKLVHRMHSLVGHVEGGRFLRGQVDDDDFQKMTEGIIGVRSVADNLIIHDRGAMTEGQLLSTCRKDYQEGARLFVLDYLQLLKAHGDTDTERATSASKCCKGLAAELNCPVIAVASLRRQEVGKRRRPLMSDLRQSGQIEYDADKIMLLYCEDVTVPVRKVECNIAKNKDGALGTVGLTMFAGQFRMESEAQDDEPDAGQTQFPT